MPLQDSRPMTASSPAPASPAPASPGPARPAPSAVSASPASSAAPASTVRVTSRLALSTPAGAGPARPAPASAQSQGQGQGAGMAAGLAAVIMWGLAPVATRALVGQLAPLPLLVLRIGLSGLVLLPWCVWRLISMRRATPASAVGPVTPATPAGPDGAGPARTSPGGSARPRRGLAGPGAGEVTRLSRGELGRLTAAGLLCMVGYNLPVTVGLQWVPASTAALILATEPVWILALGRIFLRTPVPPLCWAGAGVALAGIAVLAGPEAITAAASGRALAGTGLVLLGTA